MRNGKLYRLITVGLWIAFVTELYMGYLVIDTALEQPDGILSDIINAPLFTGAPLDISLSLWFYPLMLVLQYVVEGSFKWFPWNR